MLDGGMLRGISSTEGSGPYSSPRDFDHIVYSGLETCMMMTSGILMDLVSYLEGQSLFST